MTMKKTIITLVLIVAFKLMIAQVNCNDSSWAVGVVTTNNDTVYCPKSTCNIIKYYRHDTTFFMNNWIIIASEDSMWIEKPIGTYIRRLDE